jgi:hypothetical protein
MASDAPDKTDGGDPFDVVLVHGATLDGRGARVLRARPGQLEAGEVRPMREGQPIVPGAEVVRLVEREGNANVYDVKVDYKAPSLPAPTPAKSGGGPPQVASPEYRESWERTFARKRTDKARVN